MRCLHEAVFMAKEMGKGLGRSEIMYVAMGANDQRIYVVPGKNMVVIRIGNASDPANPNFAVSGFDNKLWEKINAVVK